MKEPTRGKNILDLALTTNENIITQCGVVPGISDHEPTLTTINLKPKNIHQNKRSVYLYNKGDMRSIKANLKELSVEIKTEQH